MNHKKTTCCQAKHCCEWMDIFTKDSRVTIIYFPVYRTYMIPLLPKNKKLYPVTNGLRIDYCPWCSKDLPLSLYNKWIETLKKEYGLDPDHKEQALLVPEEFKTDEWWKKRGL